MTTTIRATAATLLSGGVLAAGTLLLAPSAHAETLFESVCYLITVDYYDRDMVIRGLVRVMPGMTRDDAALTVDMAVEYQCPQVRKLAYYPLTPLFCRASESVA